MMRMMVCEPCLRVDDARCDVVRCVDGTDEQCCDVERGGVGQDSVCVGLES